MKTGAPADNSDEDKPDPIQPLTEKEKLIRRLYFTAMRHEENGESAQALDLLKQIYAIDYSYKDVAVRVENSYG